MRTLRKGRRAVMVGAIALAMATLASHARADLAEGASASIVSIHVEGMTCPSCKVAVRTALSKVEGVKSAKVDVAKKTATVEYDPARATPQQLADVVSNLGYEASLSAPSGSKEAP